MEQDHGANELFFGQECHRDGATNRAPGCNSDKELPWRNDRLRARALRRKWRIRSIAGRAQYHLGSESETGPQHLEIRSVTLSLLRIDRRHRFPASRLACDCNWD